MKIKAGGAEADPIAFVAMPRRSATVSGFDLEASYIRVEGFEITADRPATAVQLHASLLAPKNDGVTIRAMKGEKVTISGADLIEGWKREADGTWSASLSAEPKKVLRDGQTWTEFNYDKAARQVSMKAGGDPRLHIYETVLREQGIDLAGKKDVKIEGITVVDTAH